MTYHPLSITRAESARIYAGPLAPSIDTPHQVEDYGKNGSSNNLHTAQERLVACRGG